MYKNMDAIDSESEKYHFNLSVNHLTHSRTYDKTL